MGNVEKNKGGRPRKNAKIDPGWVEEMAAVGQSRKTIARLSDMSYTTLWRRLKTNKRLCNAMAKGRARYEASVTNALYDEAINKRNTKILIITAKNVLGWEEKGHLEHTGAGGGAVKFGLSEAAVENIKRLIFGMDPEEE